MAKAPPEHKRGSKKSVVPVVCGVMLAIIVEVVSGAQAGGTITVADFLGSVYFTSPSAIQELGVGWVREGSPEAFSWSTLQASALAPFDFTKSDAQVRTTSACIHSMHMQAPHPRTVANPTLPLVCSCSFV
jgi:hypothetical protein